MMKNLVFIETYSRHGSGIIFPCKAREKNSYIVITNYHVVRDLKETASDIKDYVNLEFYDNQGRCIEKEYIKHIEIAYGEVFDNENDIAVLLVVLDEAISIEFEEYISFENVEDTQVFTEGYPEILNDSDINRRLRLEGRRESTFPVMDKLGIYKLTDSIHWYKEFTDKDLLDGLSGGPVYIQRQDIKYLIGINQSLCNVGDGNNPFKIVYFIQMRQVFECLRKQGILLFEYNSGKIQIEWIYHREKAKEAQDINILLLGGSGAGKSSFIKEFLLHGEEVSASGDGQTTRMDIHYELMDYCDKPMVDVKILAKDKFAKKMVKQTHLNVIEYIFTDLFDLPYIDLTMNMLGYVKMLLPQLECLSVILKERRTSKKSIERIDKVLADMKDTICKDDEAEQKEIELLYDDILKTLAMISREEQITEQQLSAILRTENFWKYREQIKEKTENSDVGQVSLHDYISEVLDRKIKGMVGELPYKTASFDVINVCRGFFDIREFYYLKNTFETDTKQIFSEFSNSIKTIYYFYKEHPDEDETENQEDDKIENKTLKNYYEKLYENIVSAIGEYHGIDFGTQHNNWKKNLEDMGKREQVFLELCLKVVKGKSLSGIVEEIKIEDSISNNYAYMLKQKGLKKICFTDTCGLDHIERGLGIKQHLNQMFTEYSDNKVMFDAIFYIKKLDAGRPTELQRILPLLYNACPGKPLFCIFTGADIFYGGREDILIEREWSRHNYELCKKLDENIIPKSMSYFYENQSVVAQMPCSEEWKAIIYHVITENLIPFVADTKIRNKPEYIISNRRYLKKLFEAILLDEWNVGYINIDEINELVEGTEFLNALKKDIRRMFYKASLFDWNRKHHMTVNANVTRLLGKSSENSAGYNGVSEDRWDCLLKVGYQEVFLKKKSKTIELLRERQGTNSKWESMFAVLKDQIIAVDMRYKSVEKEDDKTEFRKSFEQMYDKESGHKYNPFSDADKGLELKNQTEKKAYLADVCDFTKGIQRDKIIHPFVEILKNAIKDYIKEQNQKRMELLLQYRSDFKEKIYDVFDEIEDVVGKGNDLWIMDMMQEIINLRKKS